MAGLNRYEKLLTLRLVGYILRNSIDSYFEKDKETIRSSLKCSKQKLNKAIIQLEKIEFIVKVQKGYRVNNNKIPSKFNYRITGKDYENAILGGVAKGNIAYSEYAKLLRDKGKRQINGEVRTYEA